MKEKLIKEKQDMTYLSWSIYRSSSGTAGSFLKAYSELGGSKIYYKLSNFDSINGIIGHECVNELIVDRLLTILGVPHLSYQLIKADILVDGNQHEVYLCASEDFKQSGETKTALDTYWEAERLEGENSLAFCVRNGWGDYIYQMMVVDYLILNRDRHGANIEVLRNSREKTIHLAPLFDHGLSLLCRCFTDEEVEAYDIMKDTKCHNFIGSKSTWENLNLIPVDKLPVFNPLKKEDKNVLLDGLEDVISAPLRDKIWDMIWERWCTYEDFCNSRRNI